MSTRVLSGIFSLSIFLASPAAAFAAGPVLFNSDALRPEVKAVSYTVLDAETGLPLMQKNENLPWPPASMTKILTALVVLEQNPKLTGTVNIQKSDEVGGSRIAFRIGQVVKCSDLIYASLVPSGNNATNAFVRCSGLERNDFINRMNQKAKDLGAEQSYFFEPTGISELNTTTAGDYAKIARAAFSNPFIGKVTTTNVYFFRTQSRPVNSFRVVNTNYLLRDQDVVVEGGKTGFINESGYNLSSKVSFNGIQSLVVVVMGANSRVAEAQITKDLAKWSWFNFAWETFKNVIN